MFLLFHNKHNTNLCEQSYNSQSICYNLYDVYAFSESVTLLASTTTSGSTSDLKKEGQKKTGMKKDLMFL